MECGVVFSSGFIYDSMCQKCELKNRTKSCVECKLNFIQNETGQAYNKCRVCRRKKICECCKESFLADDVYSSSTCSECKKVINHFLYPEHDTNMFYKKVEMVIEYIKYYPNEKEDEDEGTLAKTKNKILVILVHKMIKDKDIYPDNTINKQHNVLKYIEGAHLLKKWTNDVTKIFIRKRTEKIVLE